MIAPPPPEEATQDAATDAAEQPPSTVQPPPEPVKDWRGVTIQPGDYVVYVGRQCTIVVGRVRQGDYITPSRRVIVEVIDRMGGHGRRGQLEHGAPDTRNFTMASPDRITVIDGIPGAGDIDDDAMLSLFTRKQLARMGLCANGRESQE